MPDALLADIAPYMATRMPLDLARDMAQSEDSEILLISGAIPMDLGYPEEEHKNIIQLTNLTSPEKSNRKIALYRVLNRRRLHEVVDFLQNHGGYRCALIRPNGDIDPGYYL